MYPKTFVPSTFSTVHDGSGNSQALCPTQIWRPLLSFSLNGPQPKIVGHTLPNMAASIIRAVVEVPDPSALAIWPGPAKWNTGPIPWMELFEDPNSEKWWWLDALPWDGTPGNRLWSVFATKDYVPPPPPPPPTPVVLGGTAPTATLLAYGVNYSSTIPPGATGWGYIPTITGTGYTSNTTVAPAVSLGTSVFGGNHLGGTAIEGGPVTGVSSIGVVGAAHTGPDMLISFANAAMVGAPIEFNLTSP